MYLLDTDAWIGYLKGRAAIVERVRREANLAISTISLGELYWGARKSQRVEANLRRIEVLRSEVEVYEVNGMAAEVYGLIRADLERQGTPIGPNDLWIAAIARANDAVLVSHNVREFSRVVGLRLEDWETTGS